MIDRARRARKLSLLLAATTLASLPVPALAYQNPERFSADVREGGAGDRYFTGAPADGYTCRVCHASVSDVDVQISGLPAREYQPEAIYRIVVDWPDELKNVALNLELSDLAGRPLGRFILPDPATLTAADRCSNPLSDLPTGAHLLLADGRPVIAVSDCGQHRLSLDWQAPAAFDPLTGQAARDAWFSGSLVAANHDAKLTGDRVADFSRLMIVPGSSPVASAEVRAASCQVALIASVGKSRAAVVCWLAALCAAWRLRARAQVVRTPRLRARAPRSARRRAPAAYSWCSSARATRDS